MNTYGRSVLLGLGIMGLAAMAFQLGWAVYGLLDAIPMDVIWALGFFLVVFIWVAYAKWVVGVLRKGKKDTPRQESGEWYMGTNAKAVAQSVGVSSMEQLERTTEAWDYDKDKIVPGNAAAAAIGLDFIDEYLEGK